MPFSRRLISIPLVLMILLPTVAHSSAHYGVLAGWSTTDWDYESPYVEGDLFKAKNGFQVGCFAQWETTGPLGAQLELLYTRKGAKNVQEGTDENGEAIGEVTSFSNADYLQIPILLTIDLISRPATLRPSVFLGPYFGVKVAAKWELEAPGGALGSGENGDLNNVEDTDLGLVLGAGLEFAVGGHPIQAQVRYDLGLTKVYFEVKNQALTVMASFTF